ncbi:phosphoribosylaminoimidazolesuccinocarboxamide synthase [Heyndrickxia sp. FSL K6-6286]|uniref:Phosphoribosylaminoimidazole-succinocarboxamide synthase n=1 Tax=Heyndrickxia oleronia TaxID=38875 RepID=A0A8E2IAW1_9BACI|nr:phosphoribosylaminoimidazolesuccinocarboxamide synthase [Heyndrickxia oleronia]NYV68729.1 phosphoribosylaminoimidazolesuccinocarboxamide synthase [Bacillus sp. Gen3]OJH16600.1 phosphoribosylaminoimidazolesuccinocarboxamide synthase [Bacillus obstructivus]MBU5213876.1 phosphoribosylaminoimidazolesuccinocarboxamide synthase [Heyndrickxia oleronia]MEC1374929.1 phosphoribosylaminoimidazolesuccinocarboxamide synthase [Heyndrickxia oleronia]OOP67580.1 phosphoribosylaminoimidazolesuccinocarboxamid
MEKQELMYEGKAKRVYKTDSAGVLWIEYKDSATAFNGEKKSEIAGKGQLNNEITSIIFARLKEFGIESHFIEKISGYEQLVQQVSIIPLEVVTRNIVAGSLANRLGLEEGTRLKQPIVEFYYKNDELGDPLITEDHIEVLEIASLQELALLKQQALKINDILSKIFLELGVRLVDFKLEFGKDTRGAILLADEISPDTCRLWDKKTNQKLDKDVFRRDLGDITIVYQEILNRLKGETTHV